MRRWCRTTTIVTFVVLGTAPAVAQDLQPLRFDYAAAADCPGESEFLQRLARRTEKVRLAGPGELARRFVVKVDVVPTGAVGQLEFLDLASEPIVRRIVADSCDEAVTGLALITALAIEGRLPGLSEPPEQPPKPMQATPPKAVLIPSPIWPPTVERSSAAAPATARSAAARPGWGLGLVGGLDSIVGLGVSTALGANFELVWLDALRALRAGFERASADTALGGRTADFAWTTGSLALCPLWVPRRGVLAIWPCAGLEAGGLYAAGHSSSELPVAHRTTIFWAAIQVSARLRLLAVDGLFVDLGGDLTLPLVRHEFTFEVPHRLIFRIPAAIAGAQAAVGMRFW